MPVQGRRGTLYHVAFVASFAKTPSMAQIKIRTKFAAGHFLLTTPGLLNIIIVLVLAIAGAIFLSESLCPETSSWFSWLFPMASFLSACITFTLFALFLLGCAEDNPKWWVWADILLHLICAALVLGCSVATMLECSSPQTIYQIPGPLGLAGTVLLLLSAASIYLYYRLGQEDEDSTEIEKTVRSSKVPEQRPSIVA